MSMLYSKKVMDHFTNPRNVGEIENADGIGEIGNAKCGDIMKMYLKIDNGIITDAKFKTFGCGASDRHLVHGDRDDQGEEHRRGAHPDQ